MGKLKEKHNHKLTDLLKVCIFGLVMLAPFGAVLSRCLYVSFNKNANQSYSDYYIRNKIQITSPQNYTNGFTYQVSNLNVLVENTNNYYYQYRIAFLYKNISIDVYQTLSIDTAYNVVGIDLVQYNNSTGYYYHYMYLDNENNLVKSAQVWRNNRINNFSFTPNTDLKSLTNTDYWSISGTTSVSTYIQVINTLDNAFEYSIEQLGEMNITKWTKNTGIYTTVNQMTTGLGINTENNTMAILITYWFLMTCIYIIIDIIIFCFTKITHFMQ